jgi:hypothetical protein
MQEFRIQWRLQPYNYNAEKLLFVNAANETDAKILAEDHIERKYGTPRFKIETIQPVRPLPVGSVQEIN